MHGRGATRMIQSDAAAEPSRRIFHTLDGMRGVAALAVVGFHYAGLLGPLSPPSGYLAVDLFFIISGVVIAHAYAAKLRGGMTIGRFVLIRAIRLMPLYWLTLALAAAVAALGIVFDQGNWSTGRLMLVAACGALMIPGVAPHRDALYPLNVPSWSLAWEWVANIVYALLCRRLGRRSLIAILVPAEIALAAAAWVHGSLDIGADWGTPLMGIVRVTASFTMGLLIFDLMQSGSLPRLRFPPALTILVLALVLMLPKSLGWAKDVLAVWIVLPALCVAAVRNEPRRPAPYVLLGAISYPVYVLHATLPIERVVDGLSAATGRNLVPWAGLAAVVGVAVLGLALLRWVDQPIRAWLTRRFRRGETPQPIEDGTIAPVVRG
jgi:peptidoglycan/LPS O-acetylase OafA/YrhL